MCAELTPLHLRFPVALPLAVVSLSVALHGQQTQLCTEWRECRQMAVDAAARGEYELSHDLAWRTVQTGPRNDPALMFLLARAQALSGRPHDALVMLLRLADKGVAATAITDPDFRRTRELPGWPEVEGAIAAGTSVPLPLPITITPVAAAPAISPESPATSPDPPPAEPAPAAASDAAHFSAQRFRPAGLAFDAVSRRFVIGDALGRKLIAVGVGPGHADDMVGADSAGFDDVVALGIDAQRGDLWVASAAEPSGTSSLHRLQLVSGRPLKTYRVPASLGAARVIDLAVLPSGGVVALDAAGNRLLTLARGAGEVIAGLHLDLSGAQIDRECREREHRVHRPRRWDRASGREGADGCSAFGSERHGPDRLRCDPHLSRLDRRPADRFGKRTAARSVEAECDGPRRARILRDGSTGRGSRWSCDPEHHRRRALLPGDGRGTGRRYRG